MVIINNPHNPLGKVFTREELEHIRAWVERTGMRVIVDESYEHLIFEGQHTSFAALCDWRKVGVVTIFSASQSYAMMGWRIGFALAPAGVVNAMQTLQGPITAAAPHLSQVALDSAFACGAPVAMMADYRERRALAVSMFAEVPWMVMHSPDSGPYLWGDALGVPGFIRLGYISDDVATLTEGIGRIIAFGDNYPRTAAR
jgi:aspartate aminotransferase